MSYHIYLQSITESTPRTVYMSNLVNKVSLGAVRRSVIQLLDGL